MTSQVENGEPGPGVRLSDGPLNSKPDDGSPPALIDAIQDLVHSIENGMLDFIEWGYDLVSWPGIVLFMAIESAAIPLPSELIMPFAGWFLIEDKGLGPEWLLLAGFCGALGNLIGSLIAYGVSAWKGRPFLERYGRYILISRHDLDRADDLFRRYGDQIVFFSRLLPVVRTFISVPAGIVRMPLLRFSVLTFAGAFPWSVALAAGGYILGENYEDLRRWMRPADIPILIVLAAAVGWYVYNHVRRSWRPEEPTSPVV